MPFATGLQWLALYSQPPLEPIAMGMDDYWLQGAGAAELAPAQGSAREGCEGSPLRPQLTQSEVRHGLHLAEVPRTAIDDAQVGPAAPREQHHLGPPCEGPEAGAGDDTEPVVAGPLQERREQGD